MYCKTKFGSASISTNGYYIITSAKEGNKGKHLHRLIYEDFYKVCIIPGVICHHIDGNKINNSIENLKLMYLSDHMRLHNSGQNNPNFGKKLSNTHRQKINKNLPRGESHFLFGKHHNIKNRIKMSQSHNTTGYYRVSMIKDKKIKQGFYWEYDYYKDGIKKSIKYNNLIELKKRVLNEGLDWMIINKANAQRSDEINYKYEYMRNQNLKLGYDGVGGAKNKTGYFRVHKSKKKDSKQGFTWVYKYYDDNKKPKEITSVDLNKLKIKVVDKGLEWKIINEENAQKSRQIANID